MKDFDKICMSDRLRESKKHERTQRKTYVMNQKKKQIPGEKVKDEKISRGTNTR